VRRQQQLTAGAHTNQAQKQWYNCMLRCMLDACGQPGAGAPCTEFVDRYNRLKSDKGTYCITFKKTPPQPGRGGETECDTDSEGNTVSTTKFFPSECGGSNPDDNTNRGVEAVAHEMKHQDQCRERNGESFPPQNTPEGRALELKASYHGIDVALLFPSTGCGECGEMPLL